MYGSSALRMFGKNQAVAQAIAGRANGAVRALTKAGTANAYGGGSAFKTGLYARGARAAQYVADNPRRTVGGAGIAMGGMGLAGNGRRNNSPYQQSNPYAS